MRKLFLGLTLVVAFGIGWLAFTSVRSSARVTFPDGTRFAVEIADSPGERRIGLSRHVWLDSDRGMLFLFEEPLVPSFWMKDMDFPIDIVWIANGVVVGIERDVSVPGTGGGELPTYSPSESVDIVLELNAGVAATHGLAVGDKLDIDLP